MRAELLSPLARSAMRLAGKLLDLSDSLFDLDAALDCKIRVEEEYLEGLKLRARLIAEEAEKLAEKLEEALK